MKKYSPKAQKRFCPQCGGAFRPMTDKQWENVLKIHILASKRHKKQ